tara:strand:+ start:110 stop:493 length:384 start_codon:yes stop_codon:yes gene_type:complete
MDISNNLDEMTLRLMSNKKGLTSYLKQNNKEEYEKIKYEEEIYEIYRGEIIKITYDLLNKDTNEYSGDIIKSFNHYVKNIIKQVELKKITNNNEYNKEEDDTIFTNMEENKKVIPNILGYTFERKYN